MKGLLIFDKGVKFMRKHQQKRILDLIVTLNEANAEIRRLFICGENSAVLRLLGDCQDGVVQIGEFIENVEGEETRTVALLEEYHESLYSAGERIETADVGFVKCLQKQLLRIENSVRRELSQDRIEVAFFPYKASMWDSLESIWLAAKDDPQCDAYVVPIPYFDRLLGGAFGQVHYEGSLYPDYVPVVDWRTYQLEERRPDVIFIHNPYDDGNYVTSVHPDYYSGRLKGFTELLCYVPYFVVSNDVQEHFVLCPGVLNADRVFLQSEKVRDTYVRIFKEFEKERNCKGRFGDAESKFIASGSPKFDKVINSKPEDFVIPEEWRCLIKGSEGTSKKIVLYNTSVGAILQGNEQYVKKLRYVLNTFRNRCDVVLWWRPHPFSVDTYETMRPQILSEYEQIIADYKREGWGIYDDTADLHRSICLSSMYFGDESSLVTLYQFTGKPILLQDTKFNKYDRGSSGLVFLKIADDNECLWCTSATYNALFKVDKNTWQPEYMGKFPNERLYAPWLYKGITKCADKLYFAPYAAREAAVFDISTGQFAKISFRNLRMRLKVTNPAMFCDAVSHGQYVCFIPLYYPAIVRLDTKSGELIYNTEWLGALEKLIHSPERGYFYSCYLNDNELILPCANANALILFDMDSGVSKTFTLGKAGNRYVCACFDGTDYWLCSIKGSIYRWNQDNNELTNVVPAISEDQSGQMFIDIIYLDGHIWAFPYKADFVIKIDTSNNGIEKVDIFDSELSSKEMNVSLYDGNFIMAVPSGKNIYAHTGKSNHFIKYDTLTGEKREEAIVLDDKGLAELRKHYYNDNFASAKTANDCNYNEISNIHFGIDEFLDFFNSPDFFWKFEIAGQKQAELRRKEISYADGGSGIKIYQSCNSVALERCR